ncbi:hypothetical protein ACFQLX_03475 [Streptomyces polyrhachis]|uniref:Lipoprotein n=1 Tax=Streptomyces polyrhachis TaxID=1282885 RepID=A0ABW2GCX8_9ACTN
MKHRPAPRRPLVSAAALLAATALTSACGSGAKDAADAPVPEGWKSVSAPTVTLAYPPAWSEQPAGERAEENDVFVYLKAGGRYTGAISVQSDFQKVSTVTEAAGVATAGLMQTTTVKEGTETVDLHGTEAKRVDFTYKSSGEYGTAPEGTVVNGLVLTGLDSKKKIFAVRIEAGEGSLSAGDTRKIIDSITVK